MSFAAEVAALSEQVHAASLLDLVKAFETVSHAILASKAVEAACNLVMLRLSLAAYKTSLIEQTALGSVSKETPNFRIRSDELALHIIKYAKVKFCFCTEGL